SYGDWSSDVCSSDLLQALIPQLQAISDDWLAHHAGGEKGFSMGGFWPAYIGEFPVAVVRDQGRPVAFANIWTTAPRIAFSMDLKIGRASCRERVGMA